MAHKLDKILVIDIEATCWEKGQIPKGMTSEITEVGITILTEDSMESEGIIVRPQQSTISPFCTELTTITQEMVDESELLEDVCYDLRTRFKSQSYTFASWGDYDRRQFERECKAKDIVYPFGPTHLNVKNLYALKYKLTKEMGLPRALELNCLEFEGTLHRGIWDSRNIAKLLKMTLWED